jgi:hypothetical protein
LSRRDLLLVNEFVTPHQLEGNPSGREGITTSSTRRNSFQSMRYSKLIGQKGFLPVAEVIMPHQPEGISAD